MENMKKMSDTELLINLWHSEPALWDNSTTMYSNLNARKAAVSRTNEQLHVAVLCVVDSSKQSPIMSIFCNSEYIIIIIIIIINSEYEGRFCAYYCPRNDINTTKKSINLPTINYIHTYIFYLPNSSKSINFEGRNHAESVKLWQTPTYYSHTLT